MLYRVLVLGLLFGIFLTLAIRRQEDRFAHREPRAVKAPAPAVVHVSRGALEASPLPLDATIASTLGLAPDERISDVRLEVTDGVSTRHVVVIVEP